MKSAEDLRPLTSLRFVGTKVSEWWILLLPVSLWIWLCHDWPFRIGFYADDWTVLLHPAQGTLGSFIDVLKLVASRPVSAPYIWLAQVFVNWSPTHSQILNVAMLLLASASVGFLAFALAVASRMQEGAAAAACAASSAFIVFPSTVGIFAWGTGVSAVIPALPLFCLGMGLLLHSEKIGWRLGAGLLSVLLSHLSYEAFYFQEITVVLLAAALRGGRVSELPWRVLAGVVTINIVCVVFNRSIDIGIHKSFNPDFLLTFTWSYSQIGDIFDHAVREHDVAASTSVLGAALFGSICLVRTVGFARTLAAALVMICGVVAAGFLYAFAGPTYGLAVEGIAARVSVVLAMYSAIVTGMLASAAWRSINSEDKVSALSALAFCIYTGIGFLALDAAARYRVSDWARTWVYEAARLSRLPADVPTTADGLRIFLAIEDAPPSVVDLASQPWEIGGAVAWSIYRRTKDRSMMLGIWNHDLHWHGTPDNWFNRWDGSRFEQGLCANMATSYSVQGAELWAWKTSTSELFRLEAPWQHGC